MNRRTAQLPPGFEALEPFAESWALSDAAGRAHRRSASSEADRLAFYAAALPLVPQALAYLDAKPLDRFDEKERRLMNLLLALCHVSLAVEVQGDAEAAHAEARRTLRITRAPSDLNCSGLNC